MILSRPSNPPYQRPTRMAASSSSPPPSSQDLPNTNASLSTPPPDSPTKRKRARSNGSVDLKVDTTFQSDLLNDSASGCDSPRTKVADKFRGLALHRSRPPPGFGNQDGAKTGSRKKAKRNESFQSPTPPITTIDEIGETPDCYTKNPTTQSPSPPSSSRVPPPSPAVRILVSPPPASTPSSDPKIEIDSEAGSLSPLPSSAGRTPDQAALTWQDDEITGHELDPDGDDDGEGINGIGFRPTPAIAYARSQRRRQQVSEWKAREAREARQRRFERRRGHEAKDSEWKRAMQERTVRFMEGGVSGQG